jgi:hypothetical protein
VKARAALTVWLGLTALATLPGARLRLFAGAHAFLFQQRVAFAKVVDHFLAG